MPRRLAQRLQSLDRFLVKVVAVRGHAPGQRHDLVPSLCRLAVVHVEDNGKTSLPVRRGRRSVESGRFERTEIELGAVGHHELVPFRVVVPEQVLGAAHVAEKKKDVPVAYGPEVGTGAVVSHQGVVVVLDEGMQVGPAGQVLGTEQVVRAPRLTGRAFGLRAPRERIVDTVLLPDARIENVVRRGRTVLGRHGDDGAAGYLHPVEEQRIAG